MHARMFSTSRNKLLALARLYSEASGLSLARISTLAVNDGKVLGRLEEDRDITTATYDRFLGWFSENWPDDHVRWPSQIDRPAPTWRKVQRPDDAA